MVKKILRRFSPWAKRAGALIGVIMVLCCCMIPVSAADVGTGSEREYHSIIDFDFIYGASLYSNDVAYLDWKLNYFKGTSHVSSDLLVSDVGSENKFGYSASSSIIEDRLYSDLGFDKPLSDFQYLELFAFDILMSRDDLVNKHGLIDFGIDGSAAFDAKITFRAWDYKLIGSTYFLTYKDFTSYFSTLGDKSFDFIQAINKALSDPAFRSTDYVYLTDLRITFTDIRPADSSSNRMIFETDTMAARPIMQSFVSSSKLTSTFEAADASGTDFTTWLVSSVGSFLDFEMFPGFSFSSLLWTVFIIGLLFAFLSMLR